jgi:hypothetical protein
MDHISFSSYSLHYLKGNENSLILEMSRNLIMKIFLRHYSLHLKVQIYRVIARQVFENSCCR